MSEPRQILAGRTYLITRRCTQRQFLLKPSALTTQIFMYALAVAAERSGILVHAVCVMSNHVHLVVTDPQGRLPEFLAYLNRTVARAVNASLGRWENFWSSGAPSVVRLETAEDVLNKIAYTLANPSRAGLVKSWSKWPGLCAYRRDDGQAVQRPTVFFREEGPMPAWAELRFVPPPFAAQDSERYECEVAKEVARRERQSGHELANSGRRFLGVKAILAQDPFASPDTVEPRRRPSPRIGAKDPAVRVAALLRLKQFVAEYRGLYRRWRNGERDVVFPAGTYALRVYAGVACAMA
jgi:putative transposase